MRVFVTGATGFIGSYLVPELVGSGHQVVGLTRTEAGAEGLARAGAQAVIGDLGDPERLRRTAANVDAVIHTAFNHDFANVRQHSEADRAVIAALGEALGGPTAARRPLIVASGTGLADRSGRSGRPAAEPTIR